MRPLLARVNRKSSIHLRDCECCGIAFNTTTREKKKMHSSRGVLTKLQRALEGRTPLQLSAPKEAAVTLVIRQVRNEPELLFIKRTERETDNWSGHVAVPGGKVDEGESGREAAEREAMEECGLRLDDPSSFQFMGRLDDRCVNEK